MPAGGDDGRRTSSASWSRTAGRIPTALEQAKEVKIVRPDTVEVTLPDGAGEVVARAASSSSTATSASASRCACALNGPPPGSRTLRLESTRGGVDERSLLFASAKRQAGTN